MNPEQATDRRSVFVTRLIAGLAFAGAALYCLNGRAAAIMFALAFLVVVCHVVNVNPFQLLWRLFRRAVGHRFDTRFTWGEVSPHLYFWRALRVGIRYDQATDPDDHNMLIIEAIIVSLYIHLPGKWVKFEDGVRNSYSPAYGFYTIDTSVIWRWGTRYYSWQFPFFSFNHLSTEVLTLDGKATAYIEYSGERRLLGESLRDYYAEKSAAQKANSESHNYHYVRRSGEVQHRIATLYIDRMTWKRKWFPFLHKVRTCIWVDFNEEIGEEVGTWKGGTTGCGWELRRGERPVDALRRMETERLFEKGGDRRKKLSTTRGLFARLLSL